MSDGTDSIKEQRKKWEENTLKPRIAKDPERKDKFTTVSGKEIAGLYAPDDLEGFDYAEKLGFPGDYPYTRGVQASMYRGRIWTMRQFSGFGTPEDTNRRYKYLLSHGQTGLSVAFHLPTIMGRDSDHRLSRGEVGKCGVAIDSLRDMEVLFDGIPLEKVTTSMTINAPAAIVWAMYIAVAEKQGADIKKISGTIQNDILKEYIAQKTFIFPPKPSMKLIVDTFEYGSKEVPKWNTISISGYHIREAGSTAAQELAFTLRDGVEYVQWGMERGLAVDEFAPRLSFFFNAHNDLLEEVAKYRAARRIWARTMKERFNAKNDRSCWLRFHTQTAGCSLTAQQPYNNIVRVTIQALAAVLGGTQSLHTNSMDETLALPTEEAVRTALRTQQVIAHESGIANTIDPLGGSYAIEKLTDELEEECMEYFRRIDDMGGMVAAVEAGFPQREIELASYDYQRAIERKDKIIVGVNDYIMEDETRIETLVIDRKAEEKQISELNAVRARRNNDAVRKMLSVLKDKAAENKENLMPYILDAVREYATVGEMTDILREVYGEYQEDTSF